MNGLRNQLQRKSTTMTAQFSRLIRFIPKSQTNHGEDQALIGEPVQAEQDVGLSSFHSEPIEVEVFSGSSILHPGKRTGEKVQVERVLSPLSIAEIGTIRCIGLNYKSHAKEVGLEIPTVPVLFMKPATSLGNPFPSPVILPKSFKQDDAADFESEVAVVIGKDCKDVEESEAMDYVLGITASNDISSRKAQFAQSQWCFSKSFDGACPLGPALVHKDVFLQDIEKVQIKGSFNQIEMQSSTLHDLIFSIPKIISFLSQGTTLPAGTIILTGTPAGIGWTRSPKKMLRDGDQFTVFVSHGVGSLINRIQDEKSG